MGTPSCSVLSSGPGPSLKGGRVGGGGELCLPPKKETEAGAQGPGLPIVTVSTCYLCCGLKQIVGDRETGKHAASAPDLRETPRTGKCAASALDLGETQGWAGVQPAPQTSGRPRGRRQLVPGSDPRLSPWSSSCLALPRHSHCPSLPLEAPLPSLPCLSSCSHV